MDGWAALLILAPAVEAALLLVSSVLERRIVDEHDNRYLSRESRQSAERSFEAATPSVESKAARNGPAMSTLADREAATSA
jgi:hypothetical protein